MEIVLWPTHSGPVGSRIDPGAVVPGPVFIESDDFEDVEALRSRSAIFVEAEPTPSPYGLRIAAWDPDGNRVELRQPNRLWGRGSIAPGQGALPPLPRETADKVHYVKSDLNRPEGMLQLRRFAPPARVLKVSRGRRR